MRGAIGSTALVAPALAMTLLALAPVADAQQPWNVVGIYTGDFSGPTAAHYEGTGAAALYVVLSAIEDWLVHECGIAGWELRVDLEGNGAALAAAELQGDGPVNLYTPPDFQVGLGTPSAVGPEGRCTVAILHYLVSSTDPTYLYIRPISRFPSLPGRPCAVCGCDVCGLAELTPSSGSLDLPVFGFNTGPLAIPVEGRTWGAVRGLYR